MDTQAASLVVLGALVLLGGCLGTGGSQTSPQEVSASPELTPTPSAETTQTRLRMSTTTSIVTPVPVTSLPSPTQCLTDAAPQPDRVDGVNPSPYPEPPADLTRTSLVNWTQSFETAYFRNELLAEEAGDNAYNLTEVSAYAEVRAVNHTTNGYVLRFSDSGARNYASGLHGDRWMDVGYVVNSTHVVRVPLDNQDDPVRASAGTVVVNCS